MNLAAGCSAVVPYEEEAGVARAGQTPAGNDAACLSRWFPAWAWRHGGRQQQQARYQRRRAGFSATSTSNLHQMVAGSLYGIGRTTETAYRGGPWMYRSKDTGTALHEP